MRAVNTGMEFARSAFPGGCLQQVVRFGLAFGVKLVFAGGSDFKRNTNISSRERNLVHMFFAAFFRKVQELPSLAPLTRLQRRRTMQQIYVQQNHA